MAVHFLKISRHSCQLILKLSGVAVHGDGHTCQPRVQQTIRKMLESKLGGVGGDGNACVSKLTGIGHRVHDLIRRWLTPENQRSDALLRTIG